MYLNNKLLVIFISTSIALSSCAQTNSKPLKDSTNTMADTTKNKAYSRTSQEPVQLTEAEWKQALPADVYYISRQKGTERPWTSPFEKLKDTGTYYCAACGNALFVSDTKFESGCGWPSFYEPISKNSVIYEEDNTHGMQRVEVMCGRCKGHLGHVFRDAPKTPTGMRYCINGVVLDFEKAQKAATDYNKKQ
jgi:peptide-methionine (R)-S-oxide reductase